MAESFNLGSGARRRSKSLDSWLLVVALLVLVGAYLTYGPRTAGPWEAAATQIAKKTQGPLLFYPAWEREVLQRLEDMPIVMLDGPTHLHLAGLGQVMFASDVALPEALVMNLFAVSELRDFAGKAVSVLEVADRSILGDFARLSVSVEDPPGIIPCRAQAGRFDCASSDIVVELRTPTIRRAMTRCIWVRTARQIWLTWRNDALRVKQTRLYVGVPDGQVTATPSEIVLRVNNRDVGTQTSGVAGAWTFRDVAGDVTGLELAVTSPDGVCLDAEMMQ